MATDDQDDLRPAIGERADRRPPDGRFDLPVEASLAELAHASSSLGGLFP
jgi:hypothetical protein